MVETDAANTKPQEHVYEALSTGPPALRVRATTGSATEAVTAGVGVVGTVV